MELIVPELAKRNGVTEKLKAIRYNKLRKLKKA